MKKSALKLLLCSVVLFLFISCSNQNQEYDNSSSSIQSTPKQECNHTENEWIVATEANCTAAGLKLLECQVCGQQTKIIPATGHEWSPATCINAKQCKKCNLTEGEALGHQYTTTTTKQATCTDDGNERYTCSSCNDSYEKVISKTGHENVLQESGEDICSICNKRTYSTYSIEALSTLYQRLLVPKTATINSVYSGKYKWEENNCIVVIINFTAQVTAGGFKNAEYVILFDLENKKMTFDLQGAMQDQADYYKKKADKAIGASILDCLDKERVYLEKVQELLYLRRDKTQKLELQDIATINEKAKELSKVF